MKKASDFTLDAQSDLAEEAKSVLDYVSTNKKVKEMALVLETQPVTGFKQALVRAAANRGVFFGEEALGWPYKKLLRKARGREISARVRSNPIQRDESFECEGCGRSVSSHGRTARNHCPYCLASKHVDIVPGDRRAICGGLMPAVSVARRKGVYVLIHRCEVCNFERPNRVMLDGDPPDNWKMITELAKKGTLA
jgi:hypothetical protein